MVFFPDKKNNFTNAEDLGQKVYALELGELFCTISTIPSENCARAFRRLDSLGVSFKEQDGFVMILFSMTDIFTPEDESCARLLNAVMEYLVPGFTCYFFTLNGKLHVFFHFKNAAMKGFAVNTAMERLYQRVDGLLLDQRVSESGAKVIISGMYLTLHGIHICGVEISNRDQFNRFLREPPALAKIDFKPNMLGEFSSTLDYYNMLSNQIAVMIRSDDFDAGRAAEMLAAGVIDACSRNILPIQHHMHMFGLTITRVVIDAGLVDAEFAKALVDEKKNLAGRDEADFLRLLREYLNGLREQHLVVSKNMAAERIKRIKEYVEDNIVQYDLSVTGIADCFKVNRSLLTSQFKIYYNMSLSHYIQYCRVKKAKELMSAHADWNMERIARAAGYNSLSTMYRAFKKHDGVAPGSFR